MRGCFEWRINNDQYSAFDHFCSAQRAERFASSVFEVGHLKWCLMVHPNGERIDQKGQVVLSLHFVDRMPINVSLVIVRRTLYCPEMNISDSAFSNFKSPIIGPTEL